MAITNATLATKINDLIDFWDSFRQEYENWLSGVVGGGPSSDGKYPLTDYVGTVQTVASPAQLQDDVDNVVSGALAHKNAAETAQTAAETAETAAELAETNAETAETGSVTAKVAALAAKSAAESARTTAIAQAAAAAADAALTAADAVATAADAVSTAADAVSTDADATAAAASASAAAADAATIVAGGYTQNAVAETISAKWNFTGLAAAADVGGSITLKSANPGMNIQETDAPADEKNWIHFYTGGKYQLRAYNDAWSSFITPITIDRVGAAAGVMSLQPDKVEIVPNGVTTEGLQIFASGDATLIRPRNAAGTGWDTAADFSYDRSSARWRFDTPLDVQGGIITIGKFNNWQTAYGWGDHASVGYLTGITGESIKNLSDVLSSMTPTDGQVLTYDTTNGWQAEDAAGGAEVNDLSASVTWANVPIANIPAVALRHVSSGYNSADVSVAATAPSSPAQGDIWFDTGATIPLDYEQLDDVTITSIASGEIAKWNGTAWINNTLAEAGIAATAHTHDSIVDTNLLDKAAAETISGVYTFSAAANFTAAPTKSALGIPYYITATYTGGKITVASTAPSSPAKGDLWFDTT